MKTRTRILIAVVVWVGLALLLTCVGPSDGPREKVPSRVLIVDNQTGGPIGVYLAPRGARIGTAYTGRSTIRLDAMSPDQRELWFKVFSDPAFYPSASELLVSQQCWYIEASVYNYARDFLLSLVPCSMRGVGE